MSLKNARAFYERIVTDDAFLTQYQSAVNDDARRDILLTAGYDFTAEEWEATMAQVSESPDSALSDAELETVSGGILPGGCIYPPTLPPKLPPIEPLYGAPIS
jgi:predicted ribosomally synthesized peptide with nif11-like leader